MHNDHMLARLRRWDMQIQKHGFLVLLLCAVVLLRVPNFSEPYWYGDEGIYLTIGQSMAFGNRLYAETIDHKTPLIYYLAMTPSQIGFRLLLLGWMLATTTAFYILSRRLLRYRPAWILAGVLFVIFTTLPWLEGNIPNGELFVMGFVLVGAAILTKTRYFEDAFGQATGSPPSRHQVLRLSLAGGFLGLGILTKVPALFDFAAILSIGWLSLTRYLLLHLKNLHLKKIWPPIFGVGLIGLAALAPILISIIYFIARGSGQAYLDFGLLYNFRYAGSWGLPFSQSWLVFLFSLPGKTLVMAGGIILITALAKWLRPSFQFSAIWFLLALFAALLSNRPYPHYFLQVVPPAALLLGSWLEVCWQRVNHETKKQFLIERIMTGLVVSAGLGLAVAVSLLLNVYYYPTLSYYQNWYKLLTRQLTPAEYRQTFNSVMADNYTAAEIIKPCPHPYLFIWGTNPMLYALTKKIPTGRFTVAFHIKDFQAYDETLASLKEHQPVFVVVMNEDKDTFPAFTEYLTSHYMPNTSFEHFTLWRKL